MYVYRITYKYTYICVQSTTSVPGPERLQLLGLWKRFIFSRVDIRMLLNCNIASATRVHVDSSVCTSCLLETRNRIVAKCTEVFRNYLSVLGTFSKYFTENTFLLNRPYCL